MADTWITEDRENDFMDMLKNGQYTLGDLRDAGFSQFEIDDIAAKIGWDYKNPQNWEVDPMQLPAGADYENDMVVGQGEMGPIKQSRDGTRYEAYSLGPVTPDPNIITRQFGEGIWSNSLGYIPAPDEKSYEGVPAQDLALGAISPFVDAAKGLSGEQLTNEQMLNAAFGIPAELFTGAGISAGKSIATPDITRPNIFIPFRRDSGRVARAENMVSSGYSPKEIYQETNLWNFGDYDSPDWRYETDDSQILQSYYEGGRATRGNLDTGPVEHPELKNVLEHLGVPLPEDIYIAKSSGDLEELFPGTLAEAKGYFDPVTKEVVSKGSDDAHYTLVHELQHYVDNAFGLSSGFSPWAAETSLSKVNLPNMPEGLKEFFSVRPRRQALEQAESDIWGKLDKVERAKEALQKLRLWPLSTETKSQLKELVDSEPALREELRNIRDQDAVLWNIGRNMRKSSELSPLKVLEDIFNIQFDPQKKEWAHDTPHDTYTSNEGEKMASLAEGRSEFSWKDRGDYPPSEMKEGRGWENRDLEHLLSGSLEDLYSWYEAFPKSYDNLLKGEQ